MRALRLTMSIAENLTALGFSVSDTTHLALGITRTYCARPVHIDISYSLIIFSQYRGLEHEPLTLSRSVDAKPISYKTAQELETLCKDIANKKITLTVAEKRLDKILKNYKAQDKYVDYLSKGLISAGVSIMYSASPIILLTSFIMGVAVAWICHKLDLFKLPSFFIQAIVALFVTLLTAGITYAITTPYLDFLWQLNATILIVSGIVLMVAGLTLVAAFQDAIDEYYTTAAARSLKVIMLTGGLVAGVVVGLYIATLFGIDLSAVPNRLGSSSIYFQYIGAAIVSGGFAMSNNTKLAGIITSAFLGVLGLFVMLSIADMNVDKVAASGIAAIVIGFVATIISRLARIPSIVSISVGIVPLVPGLTLYTGLMMVIQNPLDSSQFSEGSFLIFNAIMVGITMAAGASFGNILGRPLRRKEVRELNTVKAPIINPSKRITITKTKIKKLK